MVASEQVPPMVVSAVAAHWAEYCSGVVWTVPGSGRSLALALSVIWRFVVTPTRPV